ncbi:MAG: ABC transporter permease [Lachnospiraceae bacterium]|nr:ABC transporter permease [Lachnospiraceae bacterium]
MIFLLQKTLIYAAPLLIVALAGMFAERSGIINLALEGEMIFGAFIGAIMARIFLNNEILTGNIQLFFVIILLIAGVSGGIFSILLSISAVKLKADQTIGGTALNMLAPAIVNAFALSLFNSEKVQMPANFGGYVIKNPELPALLQIFGDKAYISTYIIVIMFIVLSVWIYKTRTGLRLRSCGEHPQAAASVGINVFKMRYLGTTISGFLAGVGGYTYIATVANGTAESSVGGMGFLALAIMIFGNWKPLGIALGALLFGFLKCIGPVSSSIEFLQKLGLPMYFYNIIPYLVVLIVLALTAKKSGCPKAEGIPYDKGMR